MQSLKQSTRILKLFNVRNCKNFSSLTSNCINSHVTNEILNVSAYDNKVFPTPANVRFFSLSPWCNAKSMDRGKDKKKKKSAPKNVDENEMAELINIEKYKKDMEWVLEALKNDLVQNITVRSSTGSIEELRLQYEGKMYSVQELAQITRKPKMVVINCSAMPAAVKDVMTALMKSGMNLNPQQEGTTIYVNTPKVTKEHREQLAKNAKTLFVKHRDHMKDFQNKQLKNLKDKDHINMDLAKRVQEQVKAMCQKYISEAEKLVELKQKEVLGG